ncbi:hypothetical protein EAPG_02888 [Escherichia albertii B156]|nr:hypothetical protein EAPG_02888 [Escherichia albertii B156]
MVSRLRPNIKINIINESDVYGLSTAIHLCILSIFD